MTATLTAIVCLWVSGYLVGHYRKPKPQRTGNGGQGGEGYAKTATIGGSMLVPEEPERVTIGESHGQGGVRVSSSTHGAGM